MVVVGNLEEPFTGKSEALELKGERFIKSRESIRKRISLVLWSLSFHFISFCFTVFLFYIYYLGISTLTLLVIVF